MSESVLQKMARLWAEADRAFRTDPAYAVEMAQAGSVQQARREARTVVSVGQSELVGV